MRKIILNDEEIKQLKSTQRTSTSHVFQQRCECILLAGNLGLSPLALSNHFGVTRKTVYEWFNLWDSGKLEGLRPIPGQGCKKKLASISQEDLKTLLESNSQNIKEVLTILSSKYEIDVSKRTLTRFLKI